MARYGRRGGLGLLVLGLLACDPMPVGAVDPLDEAAPTSDDDARPSRDAGPEPDTADAGVPPVGPFPPTFADDAENPLAEIALDDRQICARRTNGDVWCWSQVITPVRGWPADAARTIHPGPGPWQVPLPGPAEGLFQGLRSICARVLGGRFFCWGTEPEEDREDARPLGSFDTPAAVTRPPHPVRDLDGFDVLAGACALRAGEVVCSSNGRPGRGTEPVEGLEGLYRLTAHRDYEALWVLAPLSIEAYCARRRGGEVDCWGTFVTDFVDDRQVNGPPRTVPELHGATAMAGNGTSDVCAVVAGQVVCLAWEGEAEVAPEGSSFVGLADSTSATCALDEQGRVTCWGFNTQGELGRGAASWGASPPGPLPLVDEVAAIAAGLDTICAMTRAHAIVCWGDNDAGQIGPGIGWNAVPVQVDAPRPLSRLAVGERNACAVDDEGEVRCWGQPDRHWGRCGRAATPVGLRVSAGGGLHLGTSGICASDPDGTLECAIFEGIWTPPAVSDIPFEDPEVHRIVGFALRPGERFAARGPGGCAVGGNELRCFWQAPADRPAETVTAVLDFAARDVFFTRSLACLVGQDFTLRCAHLMSPPLPFMTPTHDITDRLADGYAERAGAVGRLGFGADGLRVCTFDPVETTCGDLALGARPPLEPPVPTPAGAVRLALGRRHGCFLTDAGEVHCWGANEIGQLGTGAPLDTIQATPVPLELPPIAEIAAWGDHTCALDREGRVFCWGDNPGGVAGLDPMCFATRPTPLPGP